MIRIKCPVDKVNESITWIKATIGNAVNLGFESGREKFRQDKSKYAIGWKSISTGRGGMYLTFKNASDATAYRLKFGL